jgi:hypothetical protein
MMKMSFHKRRRLDSLPPQRPRSPLGIIVAALLLTATVALAASKMGRSEPPAKVSVAAIEADQAQQAFLDERAYAHLKRLQQ